MNVDTQRRKFLGLAGTAGLVGLSGCSGMTPIVGKRQEDGRTFDAGSVDAVAVEGQNGSVTVRPTDGDRIELDVVKKAGSVFADLDDVTVETTTEDGTLTIRSRKNGNASWLAGIPSANLTVRVPSGVGLGEVRSENGEVDVRRMETDTTVVTENGSVTVRDVDGSVSAKSENGSVTVRGASGFVSAESENGSVTVRDAAGIDRAESENGSVEADVRAIRGDTTVESSNGSVTAAVSPDVDADVTARSEHGGVTVDISGFEEGTRTDNLVEGTLGDGGPELRFVTENGSVTVSELQ